MTKSRGINKPKTIWTAEMLAILNKKYADTQSQKIADELCISLQSVYRKARDLGLNKSDAFLLNHPSRFKKGDNGRKVNRFQEGHQPWNKGVKGLNCGGVETQFKKGHKSRNWMPVGSERIGDGYIYVKVTDTGYPPRDWKAKHRLMYEEAYGAIPTGHVLVFKNGNKLDIRLDNLELMTLADNARRNSMHRYPPEIVTAIRTRGLITRQINKLIKESNHE